MKIFIFLIASFIFAFSFPTQANLAPSFSCAKASTVVEKAICVNENLSYLDKKMSQYFAQASMHLNAQDKKMLLDEQRTWLNNRRTSCKIASTWDVASEDPNLIFCLMEEYQKRNWQFYRIQFPLEKNKAVAFTNRLKFADFYVTGLLSSQDITRLEAENILYDNYQNAEKTGPIYKNCKDYKKYGNSWFQNTYELSQESFFIGTCPVLEELSKVKRPLNSFSTLPLLTYIKQLSPLFLPYLSRDDEETLTGYAKNNLTIANLMQQGKVKILENTNDAVTLKYDGMTAMISKAAVADFLNNGQCGIMVFVAEYTDGSYRSYKTYKLNVIDDKVVSSST